MRPYPIRRIPLLAQCITPDCRLCCSISNLAATVASGTGGTGGTTDTVNVEDLQFNPGTINITVGDVVMWIWNGAIAHLSISDATGGLDSRNSGQPSTKGTFSNVPENTQSVPVPVAGSGLLLGVHGQIHMRQTVQIEETAKISAPNLPGPYCIHVVSGRTTHGAMVVGQ